MGGEDDYDDAQDDTDDEFTGYNLGDCVRIMGSGVKGYVTSRTFHMRSECTYGVEYIDTHGNPQMDEWYEDRLSLFDGPVAPRTYGDNVVPFTAAN